jgi:hypothetical protein
MMVRGRRRQHQLLADGDLLSFVGQGDAEAFTTLYDRHSHASFSLAYRVMGERQAPRSSPGTPFSNGRVASGEGARRRSIIRGGTSERALRNETLSETYSEDALVRPGSSPTCASQRRLSGRTSLSAGKDHVS